MAAKRRAEIGHGSSRRDTKRDRSGALRDRVVVSADDLDHDARMILEHIKCADALDRGTFVTRDRMRRNSKLGAIDIDPQLIAVTTKLKSRRGPLETKAQLGNRTLAIEGG